MSSFFQEKLEHRCSHCTATFPHAWDLSIHEGIHKPNSSKHEDPEQYSNSSSRSEVSNVIGSQKKKTDLICSVCEYAASGIEKLKSHIRITHMSFMCHFCPKTFQTKSSLKWHQRTHCKVKPFKCIFCAATFCKKFNYDEHQKRHGSKQYFQCVLCDFRTLSENYLQAHTRRHVNVRPYSCTQCPGSFLTKSQLGDHMTTHSTVRAFVCNTCGNTYKSKPAFLKHQRLMHANERQSLASSL